MKSENKEILSDKLLNRLSLTQKLNLIKQIIDKTEAAHQSGYVFLSLEPKCIMVFFDEISAIKVSFHEAYQGVLRKDIGKKNQISISDDFSAPEVRTFVLYNSSETIDETADVYSVGSIAKWVLKDELSRPDLDIVPQNMVFDGLAERFLRVSTELDPQYRYPNMDQMRKALYELIQVNDIFQKNQYYELFNIAYERDIFPERCRICVDFLNTSGFKNAVDQLQTALTSDYVDKYRALYIYEALASVAKAHSDELSPEAIAGLGIQGVRAYNNVGNHIAAIFLAKSIENFLTKDDRFELMPIIASAYTDSYQYEEAYHLQKQNIEELQKWIATHGTTQQYKVFLGRSYSGMACNMVRMGMPGALESFKKAIDAFGESKGNIQITICHILHYACEIKDKNLYIEYASQYEYFVGNTPAEWLRNILSQRHISEYYFALYALLKGIFMFFLSDGEEEEEAIYCILQPFYAHEFEKKEYTYPLPLIEYYMALIEMTRSNGITKQVKELFQQAISYDLDVVGGRFNIQKVIRASILWKFNLLNGHNARNQQVIWNLQAEAKDNRWDKLYNVLKEKESMEGVLRFEEA